MNVGGLSFSDVFSFLKLLVVSHYSLSYDCRYKFFTLPLGNSSLKTPNPIELVSMHID